MSLPVAKLWRVGGDLALVAQAQPSANQNACEILFSGNAPQFLYVWLGSSASEDVKEAAMNHATQLGESAAIRPSIVLQGEEPQEYHERLASVEAPGKPAASPRASNGGAPGKGKKGKKARQAARAAAGAAAKEGPAAAEEAGEEEPVEGEMTPEEGIGGMHDSVGADEAALGAAADLSSPATEVPAASAADLSPPGAGLSPADGGLIPADTNRIQPEVAPATPPAKRTPPSPASQRPASPSKSEQEELAMRPAAAAEAQTYAADAAKAWGAMGVIPVMPAEGVRLAPGEHTFELDKLIDMRVDSGIDMTRKEDYLSAVDFEIAFGMDRVTWQAQPLWRRQAAKKRINLF